ncbi:hypothetical protein HF086_017365 [Spodoptera exigua]|uniref:Cystatin domain-containing protein n=1 Tax=Spodoptera exigua TaxID=7107 RepID=A0A922M1U1_SPOEX|nr:hypothetical protein HF086_017365 [Spodoptera exigua]
MTRIDFVISGSQDVNKCHSEIWEQAWINKKDIKVSCGNGDQRSKRETLAGGLTEQDPQDPKYRALAEESLAKFIAETGTIQPLQVVRVEKVTTQVVAGKMTRIDFVISGSQDVNKCHSEIWEQAWINKKDIKVSCGNGDQRSKRETLAGGLTEQDPNDPTYRALAEESLAKFIAETGTIQPLQVVRVEKVTTQVVAGKMTRIDFVISGSQDVNKCHSEIWEQAWINKRILRFLVVMVIKEAKRETLAGGLTEQDPNDPTYRALAEESLAKFIAETGTIQPLQVVRVEKVTTQVVAGKMTRIDFVISGSQDVNKCHSEIWEQAWINKKDIKVSCGNGDQRSKRETLAGGLTEQDPNDPTYRALAEESLAKFIAESGTIQPLQVVRVEKVTTQVVAGKMTRIDFVISGSQDVNKCHSEIWEQAWINKKDIKVSCGNGDQRSKRETLAGGLTEQDPQDPKYRALAEESLAKFIAETGTIQPLQVGSQDVNKCHSEIWEQAWINKKDIKVSCGNGDQRSKRETLAGGLTEQDPNDPTYRALAEESLAKFIAETGTIQPLQVVRVEKVTTQVVAGKITRIDFVISGSQDVNKCHSEIWEQAWINKKDIKVSCGNGDQRSKRESMAGGLTEQDPHDPKYRALAEESLAKFIAESGTIQPLQVVRVEKVTTQVVAGKMTRIDFVISGSQDVNKCHSEIWEQAWINKKDIKVSCGNGGQRSKRGTLAGGLTEQDPQDPKYRALAEESLAKFIAETGTIQPLQVVRVEKVTTQVVAGKMTRIDFVISGSQDVNKCHSEIWEQAWINKKDIKVSCGNGDQRSKRETLAGGLTEQDPNDPTYRALAEESLAKFIAESGTIQPLQVVRVEKVTTQVVAGIMTRIDFVISGSQDVNRCHSEIWEQAWINKKDIKVSCGNGDQRSKRESMAGGLTEHDPNDPKYRALAEESLAKFIAESGTIQPLQVVRVEKVTTQVVAGKMTRIDFVISGSQDVNKCHSEIWEQAWINKKDIKVSCGNGDQRSKKRDIGGWFDGTRSTRPKI